VRKVQSYGIQVQAGMIVGFDHDDATIFDEQLQFIQDARIPISMTGMLQAMPKTPLHARVAAEGRLIGDTTGDQFVFSNILPRSMTRLELYRGYRELVTRLYDFRLFRRRAMEYLLGKGTMVGTQLQIGRDDLRLFGRILWSTVVRASPRRAWFTLSLLVATLLRRPSVFVDAVTLAIVHQALYDYVRVLRRHLDRAIAELEASDASPAVLPS